ALLTRYHAVRRDQPGIPCEHDQHEERNGQHDAHRERARHLRGILLGAAGEVIEGRAQAHHDGGQDDQNADFEELWHNNVQSTRKATPVPMRLSFRHRRFSPSPGLTILMLLLCVLFIMLGRWQWRRGHLHAAEHAAFEHGARKALALGSRPLGQIPVDQRVTLTGTYDPTHQFLIDNMSYRDVDGYQVLMPLERPNGRVVL